MSSGTREGEWMNEAFVVEAAGSAPLGEPEEVLAQLLMAFPESRYELLTETPPPEIPLNGAYLRFRYWLWTLFDRTEYPQYQGCFGWVGAFQFTAKTPVMRILIHFWGPSPKRDVIFENMLAETGWIRKS